MPSKPSSTSAEASDRKPTHAFTKSQRPPTPPSQDSCLSTNIVLTRGHECKFENNISFAFSWWLHETLKEKKLIWLYLNGISTSVHTVNSRLSSFNRLCFDSRSRHQVRKDRELYDATLAWWNARRSGLIEVFWTKYMAEPSLTNQWTSPYNADWWKRSKRSLDRTYLNGIDSDTKSNKPISFTLQPWLKETPRRETWSNLPARNKQQNQILQTHKLHLTPLTKQNAQRAALIELYLDGIDISMIARPPTLERLRWCSVVLPWRQYSKIVFSL